MVTYTRPQIIEMIRRYFKHNWTCCGDKDPDCPYDMFGKRELSKMIDFINDEM